MLAMGMLITRLFTENTNVNQQKLSSQRKHALSLVIAI
jgi:hypothetical protein